MSDETGTSVGVWIGSDDDLVERFDRVVCDDGRESRSEKLREAMEVMIAVEEARPATVADNPREKTAWVKSALKADLRRD